MAEEALKKILIIEDEQELVLSLATLLKSRKYLTVAAYDSLYGISLAHQENIDLIILDLGLPAGGGFYVLENLRQSVKTNSIPILVLTARTEKELEEKALKLGAAAYMHKPFDPEELLSRISEILPDK